MGSMLSRGERTRSRQTCEGLGKAETRPGCSPEAIVAVEGSLEAPTSGEQLLQCSQRSFPEQARCVGNVTKPSK